MNELDEVKVEEIQCDIRTEADQLRLTFVLKKIQETLNKIDAKLDPRIAEAYKSHKGLTALKKETRAPFENAKDKINQSLKSWQLKKELEARLLQDKINAELKAKAEVIWSDDEKVDSVSLEACKEAVVPKIDGQYKKSNWKAKVVDQLKVPIEFWMIDEKALDKFAKEFKKDAKLEGVEFYDDFSIVTKV